VNSLNLPENGDLDQLIGTKFMAGLIFDSIVAKLDTEYYGE
jgi:hypothetical protein